MPEYLDDAQKQETRELWEGIFSEDSRSFVDYYYSEKMKDNRVLAIREDGVIQAMLHQNPYLLAVGKWRWRVDYLVGVATRPQKRHQGYMRRLLTAMMAEMRTEKMPFCFLMPASEAIYLPFGFTFIFRQPKWKLRSPDSFSGGLARKQVLKRGEDGRDYNSPGRSGYLGELARWMNQWLAARYQVYAVRDESYLKRLLLELESEQGTFDVLMDRHGIAGMQAFWGIEEVEQRLLYAGEQYAEEEKDSGEPAIMARIITPEVFVKAIHLRGEVREDERVIRLYLEDPLIPENHGLWIWHLNHEMSWMERADVCITEGIDDCGKPGEKQSVEKCAWDLRVEIAEFTAWLFGYSVPAAVGEWDRVVEPLKGVFLDEVV
ncbi:GNAT family N-acetyltransferase [Brotaphodocola sp.]|uniref:GNAT family N-acetyltransferase n=1 Tax=Brotaphodocola sp. TaxID=3073577 RepID=UPI003D7D2D5F